MHMIKKGQMVPGDSQALSAAEQFYIIGGLKARKGGRTAFEGN